MSLCQVSSQEVRTKCRVLWPKNTHHLKGPCLIEVYSSGLRITRRLTNISVEFGLTTEPMVTKIEENSDYSFRVLFDYFSIIPEATIEFKWNNQKLSIQFNI